MGEKNFLKFMNNRMLIITIFLGAALVGYTSGNVVAQEVRLGSNEGTPTISFEDQLASGMYEIRLNDGTGEFEIRDITNNRTSLIISSNGNVGVGDTPPFQDFTIGCTSGKCNIATVANDGAAQNTVFSTGGKGDAIIRVRDAETNVGQITFDMRSRFDGTVCLGDPDPGGEKCMLIFDIKGPNPGQVKQTDGTCIANC
jgi:hypothetical protein